MKNKLDLLKVSNNIMPHLVLGYPNLEYSIKRAIEYDSFKPLYLEIQIPFSDPSADGDKIMEANYFAKDNSIDEIFSALRKIKAAVNSPIVIMTYLSKLMNSNLDDFLKNFELLEIRDLIIPDLPYDEAKRIGLLDAFEKYQLFLNPVIALNTRLDRLLDIDKYKFNFYYVMSYSGVTGLTFKENSELEFFIKQLKKLTTKKIGIGFGIKTCDDIKFVNSIADFAIIGSALMD